MVTWYVFVEYDGVTYGFYYVESLTLEGAKEQICESIYNEGLINPYLHSVYQKLSFKVVE